MHCRVLSSIAGLYALDTHRVLSPPHTVTSDNVARCCQCPFGLRNGPCLRITAEIITYLYQIVQKGENGTLQKSLGLRENMRGGTCWEGGPPLPKLGFRRVEEGAAAVHSVGAFSQELWPGLLYSC